MFRRVLSPLHPDGVKFVAAGVLATVVLALLWAPGGGIAGVLTLWIVYFFRDPWRITPTRAGLILSPADGIVVAAEPAPPPPELALGEDPMFRIGIFLNLFDVHVTRAPIAGRVEALRYTKGRFVDASRDEASRVNERMAIRVKPADGSDIAFVQVAGLVARRVVCDLREGQQVAAGQRMGIIRFGSRVDVYCPAPYVPMVIPGQRMVGGETVLADCLAQEAPRQGFAQ